MNPKIFIISFLSGVVSFVALNVYGYGKVFDPMCSFPVEFGFPFTLGTYGGFVTTTHILWSGVVANGIVALCLSFVLVWVIVKIRLVLNKML